MRIGMSGEKVAMRTIVTIVMLGSAGVILPFSLDWRSPVLSAIRAEALAILLGLSAVVVIASVSVLRASHRGDKILRIVAALALLLSIMSTAAVIGQELRFHYVRYRVLHADPAELKTVGRHLVVGWHENKEIRRLIELRGVAGLYVSARNVRGRSADDIRAEIDSFQAIRRAQGMRPLWIATDQEGGIVSRVSPPLKPQPSLSHVTEGARSVRKLQQPVADYAKKQAKGLASLGINLNFAPVVDVNHGVRNPKDRFTRIHSRAISDDPAVVTQAAEVYCKVLERHGVRCTLKHFPGLGRVAEDTHVDEAALTTPVSELSETDWVPFRTLMKATRAFTMLGHVRLSEIDPDLPTSVSRNVIHDLIRKKWQYDGVLITDNVTMYGLYRSRTGMEQSCIMALNAGVDLILISWDPDQYYSIVYTLLKALRNGRLNRSALERSSRRLGHAMKSILEHRGSNEVSGPAKGRYCCTMSRPNSFRPEDSYY